MKQNFLLVEDDNNQLRNEIGQLVDYKAELPEQVFKEPELFDFYFNYFYDCYADKFINDLNRIGQQLQQEKIRLFTPLYFYERKMKIFLKQMDVPYAELSTDITEKEYSDILLYKLRDSAEIDFTDFDYLFWYFNPDCFIYGDKTSEISILAIKKSLSIKNPLKNWGEVELFAANPGEEWSPWLKDEVKFLTDIIAHYHNK